MPENTKGSEHPTQRRYAEELKQRAVRMVLGTIEESGERQGVVGRIARQLGASTETLHYWVKQADIDGGKRPA